MNEPIQETLASYYEQENKRRGQWLEETLRSLVPEMLYLKWKADLENQMSIEDAMRAWLKEEGYRMEISEDNILIQIWKGNEQIAQYQTVVPNFVQFVDGNTPQNVPTN